MSEKPYHNEPGFESPNNLESDNYNHCIRHETLRVAVCEMASKSSSMASLIPPVLKEVIHSLFPNFMESYELTCVSNKFLDGQVSGITIKAIQEIFPLIYLSYLRL
jgi:ubiquitin-conjugating enzyme E2 Z